MDANYPASLPIKNPAGANLGVNPHSGLHDEMWDEIIAVATELGTSPKGVFASVKARLNDMLQEPAAWTPALTASTTSPTLGDTGGTVGWHVLQGRLCQFWGRATFLGSGITAGSGSYRVSLPFDADTAIHLAGTETGNGDSIGHGHARDSSDAANTSTFGLSLHSASVAQLVASAGGTVNPAAPFVPAAGDRYFFSGSYWIAS